MGNASEFDSNVVDAGDDPAIALAGPGGSTDDCAPDRRATGTGRSDSGAGEKLCRSGRISPDHGRIAALRRKSDHSYIARERRCIAGPAVSASATSWFF